MTEQPILTRVENHTGILELNRPRALNSLNPEMIDIIDKHLATWAADDQVTQVVVYSNTDRAFCAGGDVRYAREQILNGTPENADEFFAAEYVMNGDLAHFPKPYISLIDGVAMGGGLGISAHGSHRVVTEKAFAAMPEMAIGYMPDVGMAYMMQNMIGTYGRQSHALALFLMVTGWRLSPADMIFSGLATHFVLHDNLAAFQQKIIADGIDSATAQFAINPTEESQLKAYIDDIEATFYQYDWAGVEQALANHPNTEFVDVVCEHLKASSPSSIVAAAEFAAASARCTDIRDELALEIPFGEYIRSQPDFAEGVRAVLVDKTRDAQFQPATYAEVDPQVYRDLLTR